MNIFNWSVFFTKCEAAKIENAEDGFCDPNPLYELLGLNQDHRYDTAPFQNAVAHDEDKYDVRKLVVEHASDWFFPAESVQQARWGNRLKGTPKDPNKTKAMAVIKRFEDEGKRPPKFGFNYLNDKYEAFLQVAQKTCFLHKVDGFTEGEKLWHFHPIAFVQHLKRLFAERELLLSIINEEINRPDVQPGYPDANGNTNVTWCNRAAMRILDRLEYDYTSILNKNPYNNQPDANWTTANNLATNADSQSSIANSGYKKITRNEARDYANQGIPILAAANNSNGPGHVGIVAPTDKEDDLLIGQAGSTNGIFSIDSCFGSLTVYLYTIPSKD